MNVFGILISIITSILLMTLPRRWAPLPFLAGVCYMPIGDEIEIGPLHFPVIRILIVVGFLRITIKSERMAGELNSLDKMMVIWAVWTVLSSFFHSAGALILHLGI